MHLTRTTAILLFIFSNSLFAQQKIGSMLLLTPSLNNGVANVKTNGSVAASDGRIGYGLGIHYLQQAGKKFFLTLGGGLNSRGYKNVKSTYFDVPVSINYLAFKNYFTIGVGAYGGFALSGIYKTSAGKTKIKFGESATDNRSRTDAGFLINMGFIDQTLGYLHLSLMLGQKNVIPKDRQVADEYRRLSTLVAAWSLPLKTFSKTAKK